MPNYKLLDINNNEIRYKNLQDKDSWCKEGESEEKKFIDLYGEELGLIINPEKENNPFAPDVLNINSKNLGDLKIQKTPFFLAQKLYGLNPSYTVVFNLKDHLRYNNLYPNIDIYFWINWQIIKFITGKTCIEVKPIEGVWVTNLKNLNNLLLDAPLHEYNQRVNDTKGNAKASYLLNIRSFEFEKLK